jgi:macrolide transport system ATP-binding/permease protein
MTTAASSPSIHPSVGRAPSSQLALRGVTRRFADRVVLDRVDLTARPGERIGVIGDNGSGKSTLLRLIAGELAPDGGELTVVAPGGIGVLAQAIELPGHATVQDVIDHCWASLRALEQELHAAGAELATLEGRALDDALHEYAELVDRFEAREGYEASTRLDAALTALGVGGVPREREWQTLSGGEQSRVALAATVAANDELLLLDEPTNDLDDDAWEWLVAELRRHRGTVIAVTHDRAFLSALTDVIWHVDARAVTRHGNGYAGFLAWRAAERERQRLAHEAWQAEVSRHEALLAANAGRLDAIPRKLDKAGMGTGAFRMRGRDHGAMGRIRNAKERIARLLDAPVSPPPEPLSFAPRLARGSDRPAGDGGPAAAAASPAASGADVPILRLDGVRAAGITIDALRLAPGDRLLVTGPNGAGKTTLLRFIAGELHAGAGELEVGGTVEVSGNVGYLRQHATPVSTSRTVLEAFAAAVRDGVDAAERRLRTLGLFRPEELRVPVTALSYGQRRRLELALLVSRPVDLLLLDEPTNHLSPDLVEDLERALTTFDGAVVIVTHDRTLRQRFGGRRIDVRVDVGAAGEGGGRAPAQPPLGMHGPS